MSQPIQKIERENSIQESPIFIVGMHRSGTTLVSRILSSHSQISISPESHFFNYWMQRFPIPSLQVKDRFEKFWQIFIHSERFNYFECDASKLLATIQFKKQNVAKSLFASLLRQYAEKDGKRRWGEKTPAHYAYIAQLLNWYPDARVIYMVRDPRAVTASMQKVPWKGKHIIPYVLRWKDSIKHLEKWRLDARVMCVKYEELVSTPLAVLTEICQFVGEDFQGQMLFSEHLPCQRTIESCSSKWAISHFLKAAEPINTDSLNRWEKELSRKQIALIEYLSEKYMIKLGYKALDTKLDLSGKLGAKLYVFGKNIKKWVDNTILSPKLSRDWA